MWTWAFPVCLDGKPEHLTWLCHHWPSTSLGPAGKEGRKLMVIQFIRVLQQLEVSTKALRNSNKFSTFTIRSSWAKSLFWAEVQRDNKCGVLNSLLSLLSNVTESRSTSSQAHNHNEDIFPLTCSSNTVKSHKSIKTRGCPWEDSFPSIGHKPSNTVELFFLCLTERHGTGLEVILPSWESQSYSHSS